MFDQVELVSQFVIDHLFYSSLIWASTTAQPQPQITFVTSVTSITFITPITSITSVTSNVTNVIKCNKCNKCIKLTNVIKCSKCSECSKYSNVPNVPNVPNVQNVLNVLNVECLQCYRHGSEMLWVFMSLGFKSHGSYTSLMFLLLLKHFLYPSHNPFYQQDTIYQ